MIGRLPTRSCVRRRCLIPLAVDRNLKELAACVSATLWRTPPLRWAFESSTQRKNTVLFSQRTTAQFDLIYQICALPIPMVFVPSILVKPFVKNGYPDVHSRYDPLITIFAGFAWGVEFEKKHPHSDPLCPLQVRIIIVFRTSMAFFVISRLPVQSRPSAPSIPLRQAIDENISLPAPSPASPQRLWTICGYLCV